MCYSSQSPSCISIRIPMDCSTLSIPVLAVSLSSLSETPTIFTSLGLLKLILSGDCCHQPSVLYLPSSAPAYSVFPCLKMLFQWGWLFFIRWQKILEFNNVSPSSEDIQLISFLVIGLISLLSRYKESSQVPQFKSISFQGLSSDSLVQLSYHFNI